MTLLWRFLKADWHRALAFAATIWMISLTFDLLTSEFAGWQSTMQTWTVSAPLVLAVLALLRVMLFFIAYGTFYARRMSFDEAYARFAVGRL